jgi:phosphatidylglycerophosphate synthase
MDSETPNTQHLKIPPEIDNPIDNILYRLSDAANPLFYKLRLTPNMITTLSMLFTILATLAILSNCPLLFVILYLVSYFFDVADGSYARRYKMTSKFGDLYDHIKDIIGFCLICYVLFIRYRKSITIGPLVIIVTFTTLFMTHMGCEQKYLNDNDSSLNLSKYFCPCKEAHQARDIMKWSRYFGPASFAIFFALFVFWLMKHNSK